MFKEHKVQVFIAVSLKALDPIQSLLLPSGKGSSKGTTLREFIGNNGNCFSLLCLQLTSC